MLSSVLNRRRFDRLLIAGAVLFALVMVFSDGALARDDIKIVYPEFQPFFSKTESGGVKGFFYDLIIEALQRRMGIQTSWTALPWKRCQEYVKSGEFDAMITVPTRERSLYSETHADPFYRKELKIFTYTGHARLQAIEQIRTLVDIKKGGFSVITYSGNGWHKKNVASLGVETHETPIVRNVWRMLAGKRGDLVIEWPQGAYPDIYELGLSKALVETDVALEAMPFHLLISKKSDYRKILPRFNAVIKTMQADGTTDAILTAYFGQEIASDAGK